MKSPRIDLFLPAISATALVILLTSCETYDYAGEETATVHRAPTRVVTTTTTGYGPSHGPWGYRDSRGYDPYRDNHRYDPFYDRGFGYNRHRDYRDHHFHRHDHHRHDDHRNDDHRKSSSSSSSKDRKHHPNSYQIVGGSTGSKVKPKGFHSISWYKSRGYDVNKLKLRNEDGDYYRKKKK